MYIAGRAGSIKAAVVKGGAPLLMSRAALQTLKASINFGDDSLTIFDDRLHVPLQVNAAGQFVLNLMKSGAPKTVADVEVMAAAPEALIVPTENSSSDSSSAPLPEMHLLPHQHLLQVTSVSEPSYQIWHQEDWGCQRVPNVSKDGPRISFARQCVIRNGV